MPREVYRNTGFGIIEISDSESEAEALNVHNRPGVSYVLSQVTYLRQYFIKITLCREQRPQLVQAIQVCQPPLPGVCTDM